MIVSEITLSNFIVKSIIPNNFEVININYISNTIGIRSVTAINSAIINSEGSKVNILQEINLILPVTDRSKTND
jgi:hypothetical protein